MSFIHKWEIIICAYQGWCRNCHFLILFTTVRKHFFVPTFRSTKYNIRGLWCFLYYQDDDSVNNHCWDRLKNVISKSLVNHSKPKLYQSSIFLRFMISRSKCKMCSFPVLLHHFWNFYFSHQLGWYSDMLDICVCSVCWLQYPSLLIIIACCFLSCLQHWVKKASFEWCWDALLVP